MNQNKCMIYENLATLALFDANTYKDFTDAHSNGATYDSNVRNLSGSIRGQTGTIYTAYQVALKAAECLNGDADLAFALFGNDGVMLESDEGRYELDPLLSSPEPQFEISVVGTSLTKSLEFEGDYKVELDGSLLEYSAATLALMVLEVFKSKINLKSPNDFVLTVKAGGKAIWKGHANYDVNATGCSGNVTKVQEVVLGRYL